MKAKIAVTTNKNGDKIAEHAGRGVFFKIYEIDEHDGLTDSRVIKVDKEHTLHNLSHNPETNPADHEVLTSQILLTGGIGMGAINKLARMGVRAYIVEEKNPDESIEKLMNNTLRAVDPTTYQHNHHHHHDHDHHHGEGHGDCNHDH
jgi:predicted Fe-Mo cluster-binding NifX family protein